MIDNCIVGSLYARSDDLSRAVTDLTITVPTQVGLTVIATATLSTAAFGATIQIADGAITGELGTAGTAIISHVRMGPNGIQIGNASVNEPENQLRLTRCLAVTFRLVATLADARALARLLIVAPVPPGTIRRGFERIVLVYNPKFGKVHYARRELFMGTGEASPNRVFEREAIVAAAEALGRSPRGLAVVPVKDARFAPGTCRVDPHSGRVIRLRPTPPPSRTPAAAVLVRPVTLGMIPEYAGAELS